MTDQPTHVLYKDELYQVQGSAGPFFNIVYPNRANYFVPKSDCVICDSDGTPMLSPSEGQQE